MFEKVNPAHPDKVADRIAGAIVDYCYHREHDPKVAVEVLIGHGRCSIIVESSVAEDAGTAKYIKDAVTRISGVGVRTEYQWLRQDAHLARNQKSGPRCGDNGIFCGMPVTDEQRALAAIAHRIYDNFPYDGKYVLSDERLIICQSHATTDALRADFPIAQINPLGEWTGGINVDSGATNRKLGSDMGDAVTGGGLHGKDLSKADVSVNIWAHLRAQSENKPVRVCCAIGDDKIDGVPFVEIVDTARNYIEKLGGFEKFAEWGLI